MSRWRDPARRKSASSAAPTRQTWQPWRKREVLGRTEFAGKCWPFGCYIAFNEGSKDFAHVDAAGAAAVVVYIDEVPITKLRRTFRCLFWACVVLAYFDFTPVLGCSVCCPGRGSASLFKQLVKRPSNNASECRSGSVEKC